MNPSNMALASGLVNDTYLVQAAEARKQQEKLVTILLSQVRHLFASTYSLTVQRAHSDPLERFI